MHDKHFLPSVFQEIFGFPKRGPMQSGIDIRSDTPDALVDPSVAHAEEVERLRATPAQASKPNKKRARSKDSSGRSRR